MAKSKTSAPAMKVKTTWKNAFKREIGRASCRERVCLFV